MDQAVARVAIALGSNLGDRDAHLQFAVRRLESLLQSLTVSRFRETAPVGVGAQPSYLNGAAVGTTVLDPLALLEALRAIEEERGRERPFRWAPRTLDLDLILYADATIDTARLTVPHPRFRDRAFVLEPLAEIAPDLVDPVTGRSVGELWAALREIT